MIHKTKGIVLRTVKYGETSLVVTVFTELFGLQSYLVNGVRTVSSKGTAKAAFFQPSSILDLVAYHNEFKNLQRLKEFKWAVLYRHLLADVKKNAVALFMIELVSKCLKQPEPNADLYAFVEDALLHLDEGSDKVTANFPLFFAIHLAVFFGFRINDPANPDDIHYLDLQEGQFVMNQPTHPNYLQDREAEAVSFVLKSQQSAELEELSLNQETRRRILHAIESFYILHIPDFGTMRSLPVLRELMS